LRWQAAFWKLLSEVIWKPVSRNFSSGQPAVTYGKILLPKPLIFGLLRAYSAYFGLLNGAAVSDAMERKKAHWRCLSLRGFCASMRGDFFINGCDGDGGDEGHVTVNFGEAFGEDTDGGQVVFLELVGEMAEPPAEHHHISGGEREREFLRRQIFIVLSIRVWLQRVFDQLAGVKTTALVFRQVELDAGAMLAGRGITGIFFEGHRR
jgi:hypothetical protein